MKPESRYNKNANLKQIAHSNKSKHDKQIVQLDNKYHGKHSSVFIKFKKPVFSRSTISQLLKGPRKNLNLLSSTLSVGKATGLSMY